MNNGIHVLFEMDKALSDNLDQMILEKSQAFFESPKRSLDDLIGRSSWRDSLSQIRNIFTQLADPDAQEIAPVFKSIFDEKKALAENLNVSRNQKDEILFSLSVQRKNLGIDHKRFKQDDDTAQRLEIAH